ncbi:DUF917 domain-containing protein [Microbacterium sp. NPDC055521]
MRLSAEDLQHIRKGALFLACAVDPLWCTEQTERALGYMRTHDAAAELRDVRDLEDDALVVTLGFVNNGLPLSDLRPAGDEFVRSLRLLERELGQRADGIIPLAGANVNALVPVLTAMQVDVPVIDADPQGRVFPLLHQSVFTLAGLPAGPVAATGPVGESAVLDVTDPLRVERLVRSLASEFGGWSATALYPMRASELRQHGLLGSISRLLRIGRILDSDDETSSKYDQLRRYEGVSRIIHARVSDVAGLSRPSSPSQPDRPSSVVLIEEEQGKIVQLEIQNELLMVLVDGVVEGAMPDIITLLDPLTASVASLEDLWVGNTLDIVILPGAARWYTPEGLQLVGPEAHDISVSRREGRRA